MLVIGTEENPSLRPGATTKVVVTVEVLLVSLTFIYLIHKHEKKSVIYQFDRTYKCTNILKVVNKFKLVAGYMLK